LQRSLVLVLLLVVAAGSASAATSAPTILNKHYMPAHTAASTPFIVTGSPLLYHGGPVQHAPHVYLTFWTFLEVDPTHQMDPTGEAAYLVKFMSGMGGSGLASVQTQYNDGNGYITNPTGQLAGVWYDDGLYPPVLEPDQYLSAEVANAVGHFGYDPDGQYVIATPHNHNTAGFAGNGGYYCAYHGTAYVSGHVVSFTNLPYITDAHGSCGMGIVNGIKGTLDGVSIVEGHEYAESATDPMLNAWYDAGGAETGDKCAWQELQNAPFSTGSFPVQPMWSNTPAPNGDECRVSYP
jgi:serine protease